MTEDHRGRKLASGKTFPSLVLRGPVNEIMQSVLWRKLVVTDSDLTIQNSRWHTQGLGQRWDRVGLGDTWAEIAVPSWKLRDRAIAMERDEGR